MRGLPNSLSKEWQRRIPPRWRIFVIAAIAGPLAAFLFAWSGLYNVAASRGHFRIFEWALAFVMSNSVETHAALIKEPPLDDPNLLILGASHFYTSCAPCHGGPGQQPNATLQNALPPAPDLHDTAERWRGPRDLLDRQARHQIHRHAGMAGAEPGRRSVGRRRVHQSAAQARCAALSRACNRKSRSGRD